jgi:hypothetical protein
MNGIPAKHSVETVGEQGTVQLLNSRELAGLFQDEFSGTTGLSARWAAEKVQGNRRLENSCKVPFNSESGVSGRFSLHWDAELQRFLAGKLGPHAGSSEYLGEILRMSAGRWASWHSLRHSHPVSLSSFSAEEEEAFEEGLPLGRSSAAMIIDSFVVELVFEVEVRKG